MTGYGLKVSTDEDFDDLSTEDNIVLEVRMTVDGKKYNSAITIEGHKNMSTKGVMVEIAEKGGRLLGLCQRAMAARMSEKT